MNRAIPLNALRVFRVAAEAGSFKAAAEQLFVTQAAVSQQIKTLEQYVSQPLFLRLNREVVLTDAGRQLLGFVQQGLDLLTQGLNSLHDDPHPHQLTISALPSFSARWLVPRLGLFQQAEPEFSVNLSPTTALVNFGDGQTDLALRFGRGGYEGYHEQLLGADYLVPLCSPHLLNPAHSAVEQLARIPMLEDDSPDLTTSYQLFRQHAGFTPAHDATASRLCLTDSNMLVEAVLAGQGYSLLRFSLVYELIERGLLICPLPCYLEFPLRYYLVTPHNHKNRPKIMAFSRWLSSTFTEIDQAWQHFHQQTLQGCQPLHSVTALSPQNR